MEELVFETNERAVVPVTIKRASGEPLKFKLVEMDGILLGQWRSYNGNLVKINQEGQMAGLKPLDKSYAKLISLNLYNEQGNRVAEDEIQGWPASTQKRLYDACEEINGLGKKKDKEETDAKGNE